jgi:hypothetical protein
VCTSKGKRALLLIVSILQVGKSKAKAKEKHSKVKRAHPRQRVHSSRASRHKF